MAQTKGNETADAAADDGALPSIIAYSEDIAEAEPPVPLPVGDYPADIRKVEQKESGAGNMYAAVSFYIKPEDYPADYDASNAPDGTILIYRRVSLEDNPQSRWRMRKFLNAIGATPSRNIDLNDWIGLTAVIGLGRDTWEGEPRAQVERVNPA